VTDVPGTTSLDDVDALRASDPSDMLGAVARLGADAAAAYAAGRSSGFVAGADVASVVVCGMGGSAVAGDLLRAGFRHALPVPVEVNRSPSLPASAGPDTLVVVSSYSGGTSETLSSFGEALERGCRILAISSGGELTDRCAERGLPVVAVPGGGQPRAALGHLAFAMFGALETGGVLPAVGEDVDEAVVAIDAVARDLGPDVPSSGNAAKVLATWIGDRVPVVWGADGVGSVAAMRWKTQLNENGKVPAWFASMSELDHNEVVGWVPPYGERHAIVALRHDGEDAETSARFGLTAEIVRDAGAEVREVSVSRATPLGRLCELIAIGDWTSCYVGLGRGVDPTPVDAIARLKAALADR
jgi:glucose/mannose-6-phosphate isomerase